MTKKESPPPEKKLGAVMRPAAVGTGTFGPPLLLCAYHPAIGAAIVIAEAATFLVVFYTALFGSGIISDRAFRLLRWISGRPEPAAPPAPASGPNNEPPPPQPPASGSPV